MNDNTTKQKPIKPRLRVGSHFKLSADALENYGAKYADRVFTVTHVSTAVRA